VPLVIRAGRIGRRYISRLRGGQFILVPAKVSLSFKGVSLRTHITI